MPGSQAAQEEAAARPVPDEWRTALSEPREDSVYPAVGDPGVDALHYDLALDWAPDDRLLEATATVTFRATTDADQVTLDLAPALEVTSARLDGAEVEVEHDGKDLRVLAPFRADAVHELEVDYAGSPEPVDAPTTRSDFSTTGWTTTGRGAVWTMQEPFGAYSWYPVNDHPSDKAFYDVAVTAPDPFVGVSGGALVERSRGDGETTTRWRLDAPAAAYLVTVAIDDYVVRESTSASGVPLSVWTRRGDRVGARRMRALPDVLAWAERRLGPYPFETLGVVLTDSESGMETQTMITLGRTDYVQSPAVVLHEVVHQWWGDVVGPTDWRDLWLNEGMTTYLQWVWEAEAGDVPLEVFVEAARSREPSLRRESGPPAAYDPLAFGESNVYVAPALMWHAVRERVGERRFWRFVRAWPAARAVDGLAVGQGPPIGDGHGTRRQVERFAERVTGAELGDLFDAWLDSPRSPLRR
ncbi:M1 family aminopeptidase [Nocardioides perillae]|uniref:Aminopeptidase N n=1 Tax=Nocardioides perillae TaxID=1119534 RepID=A0A7Y9RRD1_9ACTN|nr:aminopeptidase N [Nocardioides perillae]